MGVQENIVDRWIANLGITGKSPLTQEAYRHATNHFSKWLHETYGNGFVPGEVIARDIKDWKTYQQATEKASPHTINQRLVAINRFFTWAQGEGIVQSNPAIDVNLININGMKPKGLDTKSLRQLLRTIHRYGNVRDAAMVEVLAGTGIRVSELLSLAVGDIELTDRSGKLTVRKGKHSGYREIPLTKDIRSVLSAYMEEHGQKEDANSPLWIGIRGALKSRSTVFRMLNKYAKIAGLANLGPHTLRHTFAFQYLQANPDDIRGLAALLGHTNINTVMIYTQPSFEDLSKRMERVSI